MKAALHPLCILAVALAAAGCAVGPDYQRPPIQTAPRWSAPLPAHGGDVSELSRWWLAWGDSTMVDLIARAQAASPSIELAHARIAEARATLRAQTATLLPGFTARAVDERSKGGIQGSPPVAPAQVQHLRDAKFDASWELDLFGGARRARQASHARLTARNAEWHEARVSLAAEVALQYVNLRTCEVLESGLEADAASRAETARLTAIKAKAGFEAPASAALADASASEAGARLAAQRAECELVVKALAELCTEHEEELRAKLAPGRANLPSPAPFALHPLPADLLTRRPDLVAAEGELMAASAEIGVAIADRFPRLTLTGTLGHFELLGPSRAGDGNAAGRAWSYGPALSLPVFDAGRRAANVDAARARFDAAHANYRAKVLRAVREAEEALVRLDGAARRLSDAQRALDGYREFLGATEARLKAGAASLPELEDARRAVVAAQGNAVGVARERLAAWIALYKALGGDFAHAPARAPAEPDHATPVSSLGLSYAP
jgi:NodT family efflux transporter outer membrane factor (OMF) lipoprotein